MTELPIFSPVEARVLGVLIEKEKTVPDSYPLSLNALTLGCNQKTARDPVMSVQDGDVLAAIDSLKAHSLIVESSGSRVMRYGHNTKRVFRLPDQSIALLAILMLRGPQTAGELRSNCDRLHAFGDISSVEAFLEEMSCAQTPWVIRLPKLPGSREHRWAHLLSGKVEAAEEPAGRVDDIAALRAEVARLGEEVARLAAIVERLQPQDD